MSAAGSLPSKFGFSCEANVGSRREMDEMPGRYWKVKGKLSAVVGVVLLAVCGGFERS